MMADEASASPPVAPRGTKLLTSPNASDVLLGRGSGANDFVGNRQFREIVERHKKDYVWARRNNEKEAIAKGIFNVIKSLGGRFLKAIENSVAEEEEWYEVEDSVALEKCKQALRQKENQGSSVGTNGGFNVFAEEVALRGRNGATSSDVQVGVAGAAPSLGLEHGHAPTLPSFLTPFLPSFLARSMGPFVGDVVPFHFQSALFALQQQAAAAQLIATIPVLPPHFNCSVQDKNVIRGASHPGDSMSQGAPQVQHGSLNSDSMANFGHSSANDDRSSRLHQQRQSQTDSVEGVPRPGISDKIGDDRSPDAILVCQPDKSGCTSASSSLSVSEMCASTSVSEDEASDFLLFCLQASGRPRFTEEQEKIEQATMTDEEKSAALCDLFGRSCTVSNHKQKKARLDLDENSIEFLVQQMRLELERIPDHEKQSLVEAQMKCHQDEFTDARLERFLRCEGMNVKLGAQRFAKYWESRRELFGPEKFVLPMTLSEALRDDLVAVEACICRPLPHLDTSGRQLLLWEASRHTRKGYTSESMLRAIWYMIEVTAQENTGVQSGVVMICWDKKKVFASYDSVLHFRLPILERKCWPVRTIASHACSPSWFVARVLKPVLYALMDKHCRSRILIHDVSESQILDALSNYGILKHMLPIEMGGTVLLDQAEWIINRRAMELSEI